MSTFLGRRKKLPGISPLPAKTPPELRQFLSDMREAIAVRVGQEGDPLEAAVTRRELVEVGIATIGRGGVGSGVVGGITPAAPGFDYSPPPAPKNVTVQGGFDTIFITWDDPDLGYNYYAEVFRSKTDLLNLNDVNGPKKIGSASVAIFADSSMNGDATPSYYWVRFVKAIGNRLIYGPFNSSNGTEGSITLNPTHIVDALNATFTNRELNALKIDNDGYAIGWGYWNEGPNDNGIVFKASAFACLDPTAPDTFDPNFDYADGAALPAEFVFGYATVNGVTRFAINAATYIPEASITSLHVKEMDVDKLVGNKAAFIEANFQNVTIGIGNIAEKLESQATVGPGGPALWELNKNGAFIQRSADGTLTHNDNTITVHDSNGNLRVKIGRLS